MPEGGSVALNLYEMCWRTVHPDSSKNTRQPFDNPYWLYIFMLRTELKTVYTLHPHNAMANMMKDTCFAPVLFI